MTRDLDFYNTVTSKVEAANILGVDVPSHFLCPITCEVMVHPMVTRAGMNYERSAIIEWLQTGSTTCPLTRKPLYVSDLITNHDLQDEIAFWTWANHIPNSVCRENLSYKSHHVTLRMDARKAKHEVKITGARHVRHAKF
jgi:U-box domain